MELLIFSLKTSNIYRVYLKSCLVFQTCLVCVFSCIAFLRAGLLSSSGDMLFWLLLFVFFCWCLGIWVSGNCSSRCSFLFWVGFPFLGSCCPVKILGINSQLGCELPGKECFWDSVRCGYRDFWIELYFLLLGADTREWARSKKAECLRGSKRVSCVTRIFLIFKELGQRGREDYSR